MYDLTIIKKDGNGYIDSREVAEVVGKRHCDLLRDIQKYGRYMMKSTQRKIAFSDFFIENSYLDSTGRSLPCYLISRLGCDLIAHKLTGEKGVLFTCAYAIKFREMEAAERAAEIKSQSKPRLGEFNSAVRNVLNGMSYCCAEPNRVMGFLRGVYEPLGVEVLPFHETDYDGYYTVTEIARRLGIYSETGRPHGHAVSAIISKLENTARHAMIVPYGLIGVIARYDNTVVEAVQKWLADNNYPEEIAHLDFYYHVYYDCQETLSDSECEAICLCIRFE